MRTVRRLFYADIVSAVAFVTLGFLALFYFIDLVDELGSIGQRGYTALHAIFYSLLLAPGHLYELLPLMVLIGAIYALARLAHSSQYTILRTGGLGPGRALGLLGGLALFFAATTFIVGDYLAPISENIASQVRAGFRGSLKLERSGAWIKEHADTPAGERSYSINVGSAGAGSVLRQVRIFEFDTDGRLLSRTSAAEAKVHRDGRWTLSDVVLTRWKEAGVESTARQERLATLDWKSSLSPKVVAAGAEKERHDVDGGGAVGDEPRDRALERRRHQLEEGEHDRKLRRRCADPRRHRLEWLGPAWIAGAVGEQDQAGAHGQRFRTSQTKAASEAIR